MTMATVAYKQGTILERFWTALRLRRSKGPRETNNLIKFRSGGPKLTCALSPLGPMPHTSLSCAPDAPAFPMRSTRAS